MKALGLALISSAMVPVPPPIRDYEGHYIVFFHRGNAHVNRYAQPILNIIGEVMAQAHPLRLVITGHTDATEGLRPDRRLPCRRALAARNYLVSKGVPLRQITAMTMGSAQPLPNVSPDGAQQRRVEIDLVWGEQDTAGSARAALC